MPDHIADMMDLSSVVEFLESLETKGIFERLVSWKTVVTGAEQARFALEMITEEYREKVSAYRRTVHQFEDDRAGAYADYAALRDESQEIANRLWRCEQRECRLRTELERLRKEYGIPDDAGEDGLRKKYRQEIERDIEEADARDCRAEDRGSEGLKTTLAAPFITLRSSSLAEPQVIEFLEAWMEIEEALKMIRFAVSEGYYVRSGDRFLIRDDVLDIESIPPDFRPSRSVIAEVLQENDAV